MRIPLTIRGFAVAIFVASGSTANADPFDLRAIQLGITLPEFRKISHPDQIKAKIVCSTDAEAKKFGSYVDLKLYGDDAIAGAVMCKFLKLYTLPPLPSWATPEDKKMHDAPRWVGTDLNVATVDVAGPAYKFIGDPTNGGILTLYSIVVRSNVEHWNKFWEGYVQKYGKPQRLSTAPTQNKMGATFDNVEALWDNQLSTITLIKRLDRIDNTYIIYEHTRLAGEIKRLVQVKKGRPADKL